MRALKSAAPSHKTSSGDELHCLAHPAFAATLFPSGCPALPCGWMVFSVAKIRRFAPTATHNSHRFLYLFILLAEDMVHKKTLPRVICVVINIGLFD
jgi:hypothetical protein